MIKKIWLLFDTVSYLKPIQIYHQLFYRLKKKRSLSHFMPKTDLTTSVTFLSFEKNITPEAKVTLDQHFVFLNLSHDFLKNIDWDFNGHGKLWNYNLQYFSYLNNDDLPDEVKIKWLKDIGFWLRGNKLSLEPYPTSLRIINSIRFYSRKQIKDKLLIDDLFAQLNYLEQNLEYHLLGNHLLENAFALIMGGYFFNQLPWIKKAEEILTKELDEQILNDGAHFELSPMYHQIILFRMLELIDWYRKIGKNQEFIEFVVLKTKMMLSFLKQITFVNGDIPHFSDSSEQIAPNSNDLFNLAISLKLEDLPSLGLKSSGYRRFNSKTYECIVDCGAIGPDYQPAHGHADALSFILYANKKPFLVEPGTSTYQIGDKRNFERSTSAHNTVVVRNTNQSQVWGGFRVGSRANVTIHEENESSLTSSHTGYSKKFNVIHNRHFNFWESEIIIKDTIDSETGIAYFYIHPSMQPFLVNSLTVAVAEVGEIKFEGAGDVVIADYEYAIGYNRYSIGKRIEVRFTNTLKSSIKIY